MLSLRSWPPRGRAGYPPPFCRADARHRRHHGILPVFAPLATTPLRRSGPPPDRLYWPPRIASGEAAASIHRVSHRRVPEKNRPAPAAAESRPAREAPAAGARAGARPQLDPDTDSELLFRAGMAMARNGDLEGAIEGLRMCVRKAPANIDALGNLGMLEQRAGRYREAEEAFRCLLMMVPDHASTQMCLANVLMLQDRIESAAPIYEALLRGRDPPRACKPALCKCYLQAGRWSEALALCDQILAGERYHAGVLSMRRVALTELGRIHRDNLRLGQEPFVRHLSAPPGIASMAAWNQQLVERLAERHDLVENPHDKTTRGGRQTGDLMAAPDAVFESLGAAIRNCVEAFLQSHSPQAPDFYLTRSASNLRLTLWGTILTAGGHQEPHIHQAAWLSGVYYARLPARIRPDDASQSGWIEFGRPPSRYPCRARYPVQSICPREGMLVLFPAYLFHRTIPLQGDEARVSFAFDVIAS